MDCFDGAEHVKTKKKNISFISFSTVMTCKSTIESGQSTSTSFGILTWMQLKCAEKREYMFPILRTLYKEKSQLKVMDEYKDIEFVDMHDQKMSYMLTQHSLWNRVNYFALACKCKKCEGVQKNDDPSFTCQSVVCTPHFHAPPSTPHT